MRNINIKIEPKRGKSIDQACGDAKELSEFIKEEVEFEFNGVFVTTENHSIDDMIRIYRTSQ